MDESKPSFPVVQWLFVALILVVAAAVAVPLLQHSRMTDIGCNNCGAALKQLVNHESIWRQNDSDKNGIQDYWTRDVAAFHCMHDVGDKALAVIDLSFARADKAPALAYPELGGVNSPRQGYFFQAMTTDQDGNPYVDPKSPAPTAKNAPSGPCTNPQRFGFTAFPSVYSSDGVLVFMVDEDGVVWQKDTGAAAPELNRKTAAPETAGSGWSMYGG